MSVAYDVYLYADGSDEALEWGSTQLARGFDEYEEALDFAQRQVLDGHYERAIVGQGEDVHEVYDTATDEDFQLRLAGQGVEVPEVAPPGPRTRHSALAERALVA